MPFVRLLSVQFDTTCNDIWNETSGEEPSHAPLEHDHRLEPGRTGPELHELLEYTSL